MNRDQLLGKLKKIDEDVFFSGSGLGEKRASVVIVGGSALLLHDLSAKQVTKDVDVYAVEGEIREALLSDPDFNMGCQAYAMCMPYNFDQRLVEVDLGLMAMRVLTPSLEDLAVMKLYRWEAPDIADLTDPAFIEKVDTMRMEHKVGERVLGTDPATGRRVSVKIGRFGPVVQIGEVNEEEKPQFASLTEGQSLQTITLEEALKLFELPRKVGEFEGAEVTAAIGRFGPYIRHNGAFVSIPKDLAPQTITLEEAVALIMNKREEEANRLIKSFDELPGVEVLRGRFGPYIAFKKEGAKKAVNYKIPKGTDPESLTADDVKALMEAQDAAPKKKTRSKK